MNGPSARAARATRAHSAQRHAHSRSSRAWAAPARPRGAVYRFSRTHLPPRVADSPLGARLLRRVTPPSAAPRALSPRQQAARAAAHARRIARLAQMRVLPRSGGAQRAFAPPASSVPRLRHGLAHVLRSPGVHWLRDRARQRFNFDPYLAHIHQPETLRLDRLPPFTPASRDARLAALAHQQGCRYVSSTSSWSPLLSQLVHLLSNFRDLRLQSLSAPFSFMTHRATSITLAPISFIVRRNKHRDGVLSVDAHKINAALMEPTNRVLMDLGKTLEAMLTLDREDFERELVHGVNNPNAKNVPLSHESYHYLQIGSTVLRSQLDCVDESLPGDRKTFDLKTRATLAVRRDVTNYAQNSHYRIDKLLGETSSYEREYYDMARSAFLKYNLQVRIGRMHGIFVAYHSTREIFGFEYLSQGDMDECLYGSTHAGDVFFDRGNQLAQVLLDKVVSDHRELLDSSSNSVEALRCLFALDRNKNRASIFVEAIENDKGWDEDSSFAKFDEKQQQIAAAAANPDSAASAVLAANLAAAAANAKPRGAAPAAPKAASAASSAAAPAEADGALSVAARKKASAVGTPERRTLFERPAKAKGLTDEEVAYVRRNVYKDKIRHYELTVVPMLNGEPLEPRQSFDIAPDDEYDVRYELEFVGSYSYDDAPSLYRDVLDRAS